LTEAAPSWASLIRFAESQHYLGESVFGEEEKESEEGSEEEG